MIKELDELRKSLADLSRRLQRLKAKHVNSASDKKAFRDLVQLYFRELRSNIANTVVREDEMVSLDRTMQDFLRCTQRRAAVSLYRKLIRKFQSALNELEVKALRPSQGETVSIGLERKEQRILETLREIDPSAAESYEQGLADVAESGRKSWRGTMVEFREALREVLDKLAPDGEVSKEKGFQLEAGAKGPTMKQKTAFILRKRRLSKTQAQTAVYAAEVVEEMVGKLVRSVYARASVGVHAQASKGEADKVKDYVTLLLGELLEVRK